MARIQTSTFRIMAVVAALGIVTISSLSEAYKHKLHTRGHLHIVGHLLAFGLLSYLALGSGKTRTQSLFFVGTVVLMAVSIEIAEHLVTHYVFEWADIVDDLGASAIASLMFFLLRRKRWAQYSYLQ